VIVNNSSCTLEFHVYFCKWYTCCWALFVLSAEIIDWGNLVLSDCISVSFVWDFCVWMQDLDNLYNYLHQLESCRHYREVALKQLCKVARYEWRPENSLIFTWDFMLFSAVVGWLDSRVVSVLDSGAELPGFKSQPLLCQVIVLGKLFTSIVPLFTKQQNW